MSDKENNFEELKNELNASDIESSEENTNVENVGSDDTVEVPCVDNSQVDEELPPLDINASENPEEVREVVSETLKEAEGLIEKELSAPVEGPTKVEESKEEKLLKTIKKQNRFLKGVCIVLALCTMVNGFLAIPKINKSKVYVSDSEINKIILTDIKTSGEALSASQIYNKNIDSVVAIQSEIVSQSIFGEYVAGASAGSGFIISEDGYVLTNYHVVEDSKNIKVILANGLEYSAELIGFEEDNDIAVLKLQSEDSFKPVVLGKSEGLVIGEDVVAIGNPLGELTFSITKGIVSAVDRNIQIDNFNAISMFQVDCAVNQGNSGGPIFNMYGEVVGIVSAKYASETIEGLGFSIPIDDVVSILPDLVEHGKVMNKSYMGISVADLTEQMITQYNMVPGAYVSTIEAGSCAEKAGLKIGDIITKINGKNVSTVSELLLEKRNFKAGDTTTLTVWRGGEYVDLTITFDVYVEPEEEETPIINNVPQNMLPGNPGQDFSIEDYFGDYMFGN